MVFNRPVTVPTSVPPGGTARVLRTETAGIVALAVLQALWGDLQ